MARLEGSKPNTSAIIIGAIIFALVAAGLFLAFRPVAEPTGNANEVEAIVAEEVGNSAASETTTDNSAGAQDDGLTPILTPLPTATSAPTPTVAPTVAPTIIPTVAPVPTTEAMPLDLSDAPPPPIPPPPGVN